MRLLLATFLLAFPSTSNAEATPDWSEGVALTAPRSNPYELSAGDFKIQKEIGLRHTLDYPVTISAAYIPWRPLEHFLDEPTENPIRKILTQAFKNFSKINSTDDLFAKLGLHTFPQNRDEGGLDIPSPRIGHEKLRMGVTQTEINGAEALTISCAACHSSNLFGKKILGLTNRFPEANNFFVNGKKVMNLIPTPLFRDVIHATPEETALYDNFRNRSKSIGAKNPLALGLDTSLAQVALSLARRNQDDYATFNPEFEKNPREEFLKTFPADSKPAVWWNLKYKNRWLSDGSVVAGNPIFTNFIWNEIGRGTDLHELENWLKENADAVKSLTTAVFSSEPPRYTDFFPPEKILLERAQHGEALFNQSCAKCHGVYIKNWSLADSDKMSLIEKIKTAEVRYLNRTPVRDVKTDPNRWQGMTSLEKGLNPLAISKSNGIIIRAQKGYVPPPLVGIWTRFPYFHNNSIPNLCELLTRSEDRASTYWSGPALDKDHDFDSECVGYPIGEKTPAAWKTRVQHLYDTKKFGMRNFGHDEGIFLKNGAEIFSKFEKNSIIEFLKTL